jgi:hypothetical protein
VSVVSRLLFWHFENVCLHDEYSFEQCTERSTSSVQAYPEMASVTE